MLLHFNNVIAR